MLVLSWCKTLIANRTPIHAYLPGKLGWEHNCTEARVRDSALRSIYGTSSIHICREPYAHVIVLGQYKRVIGPFTGWMDPTVFSPYDHPEAVSSFSSVSLHLPDAASDLIKSNLVRLRSPTYTQFEDEIFAVCASPTTTTETQNDSFNGTAIVLQRTPPSKSRQLPW